MIYEIFERYQIFDDTVEIHLRETDNDGRRAFVMPAQLCRVEQGQPAKTVEPWMKDDGQRFRAMLQAFLDLAWTKGMRPKDYADYKDQLVATKDHLNDMRAIVGGTLKITLPGDKS